MTFFQMSIFPVDGFLNLVLIVMVSVSLEVPRGV